jgi:hypothetical protein
LTRCHTDTFARKGLTIDEAASRLKLYGPKCKSRCIPAGLSLLFRQLGSPIALVLSAAAILSFAMHDDGRLIILFIVATGVTLASRKSFMRGSRRTLAANSRVPSLPISVPRGFEAEILQTAASTGTNPSFGAMIGGWRIPTKARRLIALGAQVLSRSCQLANRALRNGLLRVNFPTVS